MDRAGADEAVNLSSSNHSTVLARIGRNSGWLGASAAFSAIASLVYVGLAARALGPAGFGSFAVIMTFGELITNFAQFQSWKAITSYGSAQRETGDEARLSRLIGYAATLDWVAGLIGAAAAIVIASAIAPLLHWSIHEQHSAALFGAALLLTSSTAPAGVLRVFDRFDLQVLTESLVQITRFAGCFVGWMIGAGVDWFLAVWALAALQLLVSQWLAVVRLGHRPSFRSLAATARENAGLWPFMLKTNVSSSLSLFWMQFGTLAVGAGAGAIEAGGFRLAYRFSQAMMKPVEIATKALFPEFARLVSEDDHSTMRKVLMQVSAISGAFACVVIVGTGLWGREILRLVAGPRFEYASGLLFLLSISAAINVIGFALEPFHNAHFRAGTVLRAYAVAAVVYAALLAILLPLAGADGAALASIVTALAILVQLSASAAGILAESRTGESERKILDTRT